MRVCHVLSGALCLVGIAASSVGSAENAAPVPLSPYRAVYDMALDDSTENKGIEAAAGRFVIETMGSACEGYTVKSRQIINLQTENGMQMLDSTSDSYESGDGKTMRFRIESRVNDSVIESTDGEAIIGDDQNLQVRLTRPQPKRASWKGEVLLPTMLSEKIIAAARAGQPTFSARTYDGSAGGEALYDTFTLIGRKIAPGDGKGIEEAAAKPELQVLPRWPIKISYFKRSGEGGERAPDYTMSAELYENGITRAMRLNFPEFSVKAELKNLTFLPAAVCPKKQ